MATKIVLPTVGSGLPIVQLLAQRSPALTLLVASRKENDADEAVARLHELGLKANFRPLVLDVSSDESIRSIVGEVKEKFGRLDVLINNAGIAGGPKPDSSDFREVWSRILDTNVTSVGLVSTIFLPLLRKAADPKIINISSGRGSLSRVTSGANPPTDKIAYSVSKAALNLMTIEMSHANPDVEFQVVNPGWCKTALNGFRGPNDPLAGAESTVELALSVKGRYAPGFWEVEGQGMQQVPW